MEQKQRALVLRMDDARQELIGCVNNMMQVHGLTPYLIEPMLADIYAQIKDGARNELAQARAAEAQKAKDGAE